ncbi:RHS repeat-associated core domain-containing protein [Streptomyces sp. NPDC060028]|uniref:RHS repeat-associated core domain-containing protein n=1 Tax=Streptomyces sp. NPDC060028 TaxID=3347041 RepID=UPI00368F2F25
MGNTGSTYLYDAAGQRLLRRESGKTTLYLGSDELTLTASTGKVTGARTYAGFGGGPSIVRTPTGLTYTASDHHGTATTTLDAATLAITRRAQKPYGESRGPAPAAWPDDKGFLGKPQDTTGLTHVGAREYDPALGRFISVDPVMDLDKSQQIHGYLYAGGNPVTNSDPTGLDYCPSTECNHYNPDTVAMLRDETHEEGVATVENTRRQEKALGIPWRPSTVTAKPTGGSGRNLGCDRYCQNMLLMLQDRTNAQGANTKLAQQLQQYVLVRSGLAECAFDGTPGMRAGCMEKADTPGQDDGVDELLAQWISGRGGTFVYVGKDAIVRRLSDTSRLNGAMNDIFRWSQRDGVHGLGGSANNKANWKGLPEDLLGIVTNGHLGTNEPQAMMGSYNMVYQTIGYDADSVQVAVGIYNATGVHSLTHSLPDVPEGTPGATTQQYYFWTVTVTNRGVSLD